MNSKTANKVNEVYFGLPGSFNGVRPIRGQYNSNNQQCINEMMNLIERCNYQCRLLIEERVRIENAMNANVNLFGLIFGDKDYVNKTSSQINGFINGGGNRCSIPLVNRAPGNSASPKLAFDNPRYTGDDNLVGDSGLIVGQNQVDHLLTVMLKEHSAIDALLARIKSTKSKLLDQEEKKSWASALRYWDDSVNQWLQSVGLLLIIRFQLKTSSNCHKIPHGSINTRLMIVLERIAEKIRSVRTTLWLASIY